jgi:hypothetical protein
MKKLANVAVGALMAALGTAAATAPAAAGVSVGIGIGIPGPAPQVVYGPGYYPPGPCAAYNSYYEGDCGYPVYSDPIFIDGAWYYGPHYYSWWGGRP